MSQGVDTTLAAEIAASGLPKRGGRPAAGTDPEKRKQIIEGAGRVFTSLGFDAATMSDVARQADVSKATLYVYFPNKEELFAAICAERRDRSIAELISLLDTNIPVEDALLVFGRAMIGRLSDPFVMAAHRIVIGVAERMPEIGKEMFAAGPTRLAEALAGFIKFHSLEGKLDVDDPFLTSVQFLELCQATIFRPRLYRAVTEPPGDAEIDTVVRSAVRVLMAAYGKKTASLTPPRSAAN